MLSFLFVNLFTSVVNLSLSSFFLCRRIMASITARPTSGPWFTMTLGRDGPFYSPRVPFEKVTVLSIERSPSEPNAVGCFSVTTDMPLSLKEAIWDDRKLAISWHTCMVGAAPFSHLSVTTGGNRLICKTRMCVWTSGIVVFLTKRHVAFRLRLYNISFCVCPTKRHHTNPVGTEWRWKMDPAEKILQEALEKHQNMIRQFRGLFLQRITHANLYWCSHLLSFYYSVDCTSYVLILLVEMNMGITAYIFIIYTLLPFYL